MQIHTLSHTDSERRLIMSWGRVIVSWERARMSWEKKEGKRGTEREKKRKKKTKR